MTFRRMALSCALGVALLGGAPDARAGGPNSAWEYDSQADEKLYRMQESANGVRSALAAARALGDVARVTCMNEKLAQVEEAQRQARDRRSALRSAALRGDAEAGEREAQALAAVERRIDQLRTEASQCASAVGDVLQGQAVVARGKGVTEIVLTGPLKGAPAVRHMRGGERVLFAQNAPVQPALPAMPASPAPTPPPGSPYVVDAPHDTSMLVYTSDVTLAVFEVDKGLASVETIATDLSGYLSQRTDRSVTIRVPRHRFGDAMKRIEKLGDVLHRTASAEDVTDEYVDLELRLKNARATRDRLEKLLEAASVKDAVEIHRELVKVTEEIEHIEGRLKLLRDRIGFSTITVTFQATSMPAVRSNSLLPFPWLHTLGLPNLLQM